MQALKYTNFSQKNREALCCVLNRSIRVLVESMKTGPSPVKTTMAIFVIWQVFGGTLGSQDFFLYLFFNSHKVIFFSKIHSVGNS